MKKKLSSEELLKLPKEEFIKYMEEIKEDQYNKLSDLGDPNYFKYSFDVKVNFWCENLNKQMRIQAEGGFDVYVIFNSLWYKNMKRIEPDLDLIIDKVFEKFKLYHWEWSKEEYLKRINESK